jgi:bacteriorhodopsin
MTPDVTALTETLGALVGVVGISIAVWLQLVSRKRTPARYVFAFFAFGAVFLLTNAGALNAPARPASLFGLLGVLVALVFECGAAVFVWRRYSVEGDSPAEVVRDLIHDTQ